MAERSKYKTRQSEFLLKYLKSRAGEHVTAGDVCAYFKRQGLPVGQSTVYRRLENLVDEGVIKKYALTGGSACFEYVGEDACEGPDHCFHCKCTGCGRLIHLHCEDLEEIQEHLLEEHGFRIDPMRTVFYGLCEDCR